MSRDTYREKPPAVAARCGAVWLVVSGAVTGAWWACAGVVAPLLTATGWTAAFDDVLVRMCAAALLTSLSWLWAITTSAVTDTVRGRTRPGGATRRLVLVVCGVAVAVGSTSTAATASDGTTARDASSSTDHRLSGLVMPDRAVGGPAPTIHAPLARAAHHPRPGTDPGHVVVRLGDTLWSISRASGRSGAQWREIWEVNRDVIGHDPDLILPGQRLRLPTNPLGGNR